MQHNLITTGDMQRFIMDSYEECRGPPRLFLLDKFDIAGAGACLKRYSDPSFFKTEFSHSKKKKSEVQRETKARKIKVCIQRQNSIKDGALYMETVVGKLGDSEVLKVEDHYRVVRKNIVEDSFCDSIFIEQKIEGKKERTSHIFIPSGRREEHVGGTETLQRLRQLFSDENGSASKKVPMHAVNLKRKHLNGSSFNSVLGKSYMECVLENSSPKHAIVQEHFECNTSDLASEVHEIGKEDFANNLLRTERKWISSPNGQVLLEPSLDELGKDLVKEQSLEYSLEPTAGSYEEILSSVPEISDQYVKDDDERRMEARETEAEEICSDIHQAGAKDEFLEEQSKLEDDGDKTALDKLPFSYLQVGQKAVLFDVKSKTEVSNEYRSAESEEEGNNNNVYPEDQRDEFDGKSEAEAIDDDCGTDNVDRNSSFIHAVDQKEFADCKSMTEANDDGYVSNDAEKNDAVIYKTDHDGYHFDAAEKKHSGISTRDQKDALLNDESKLETSDYGHGSDDAASELDNYMDALTTMDSEMETDTESRAKHERIFLNIVTTETYESMNEKRHVYSNAHPIEDSSTSYDLNGLFKKQRSSCSDSSSNLADIQVPEDKGITYLDTDEKFNQSPNFKDAMAEAIHSSSSSVLSDKSPSPLNGDAGAEVYLSHDIDLTEVHDYTPDEFPSCDGPGTKSPESFVPIRNINGISEISHFVSESGEMSCSSCITDAAVALIHSSSGASLNDVQLIGTEPSRISSLNIEAMGNHSGDDLLLIPEVSSHCAQMEDAEPATFAKSSSTGEDYNVSSDSGVHSSDISDMPQGMKDVEEDCSNVVRLTNGHLDDNLGDLQATFESYLPLQTEETAVPEKALTDSSTSSVCENWVMLDLPSETSPMEDQLSLAKSDIDACSTIPLPPECLSLVQTVPIDASPCALNSQEEITGPHSSCEFDLLKSIELRENEQTSEILLCESVNSNMESLDNNLDKAVASAVSIETERSLFSGQEEFCGSPKNKVRVAPVSLPLKSPVENLPVEVSVQSDDVAIRSIAGVSICNNDGPSIDSRAPSNHLRLFEEVSLHTEVSLDQHKIERSEQPIQEDNIALTSQHLTALSDNEANELLVYATDPVATAVPCQPDSKDLAVSEHLAMHLEGARNHSHSDGDLDASLLSKAGSQNVEQKLGDSDQPVGPKSPDQIHPYEDEKDAASPSTHFLSEPSVPPEQILDAISSHDKGLAPADHLFERKKSPEETVRPITYEVDHFNSHSDSSLVDQLIQQLSESKLKPESLVVATDSIMNGPAISSPGFSTSPILKPEAQMQLPPSHYYQASESPTNLLNSAVAGTPSLSFPSIDMQISEAAYELQPSKPMLGFPLSKPNLQSHEMEDMPPLPPLPPLEWRIGKLQHNSLPYGWQAMHPTNPFLTPQIIEVDRTQQPTNPCSGPQTVDIDKPKQPLSPFGLMPATEDERSQDGSLMSGSITVQPPNPYPPFPNVDDGEPQLGSQPVEEVREHHPKPSTISVILEDQRGLHDLQNSEDHVQQSVIPLKMPETEEDQKENGKMQSEHTKPRDPLIEAVAAHDRNLLRKVSERFPNETGPKSDERDSFLGQIRAKSFNLKPTTSVKPIMQGPRTNLNVVAILEKANAIRQAFAGSDEDNDSDGWSDS
ncbi:hypothetical protein ACLOJK_023131 [Asimina triloba]